MQKKQQKNPKKKTKSFSKKNVKLERSTSPKPLTADKKIKVWTYYNPSKWEKFKKEMIIFSKRFGL